ncbi:unannotated protein [freshwater metagenome]|uniref:Unannotated protein n=1 Tax=freshwater metagenome TaxID=449393 RepID=A0A6J6Z2F9_9ZZZZ
MRLRARQEILELFELVLLVLIGNRRCIDLVTLEAQKVHLAGSRPGVATQRGKRCIDLGQSRPCLTQGYEIRAGETVQCCPLRGNGEQALVCVLPVEVNEPLTVFLQDADRGEPTVDIRATAPVVRDRSGKNDLIVADNEAALDPCLISARPNEGAVGAPAQQEFDRTNEHRLSSPGLAREHGEAGAEHEIQSLDHSEVLDMQLGQHGSVRLMGIAGSAVCQSEFRAEHLMEAAAAETHE